MTTSEPDQPHKHDGDRDASGVSGEKHTNLPDLAPARSRMRWG